ncbi:unnamed protein product [Sphagnum jensenii]|uniref:GPI ethanolamine phosphate transferase 2 C-terminal domain-containing protein n=1 Tax=Sphagnum jensenii TaxID=128206 RepID=A0ABP0VY71_9BRYO
MAGGVCERVAAISLIAVLLQLAGLTLFVLGFFPVKPALMGIGYVYMYVCLWFSFSFSDNYLSSLFLCGFFQEVSGITPQYDRLIIMVVDGLPAEFVLGRGGQLPPTEMLMAMPYTQKLLTSGRALGFHAKAAPPTVTMPRLKAMTSGAIAGFLDVAFNFNTQALLGDNLISQLARAGWQMVMLGDETWLRLFPNTFMRHDGVSSFFVKDTVQVDHNVSRHLDAELAATDWDLLVLHYLGLDHVGHLGGRNSPLMPRKLKEMDAVVQKIHQSLTASTASRNTLLLVGSDHGMTDGGNHGGASYQETDSLALFILGTDKLNPSCDLHPQILSHNQHPNMGLSILTSYQVDMVPTLALQLGVPIPKNSVGVMLAPLFVTLPYNEQLRMLELNAWQLFRLLQVRSPRSLCITSLCSAKLGSSAHNHHFKSAQYWGGENEKGDQELCALFGRAIELHESWRHNNFSEVRQSEFESVHQAYLAFLKPASERLARGTTEKNTVFLISGFALMLFSTIVLIWTLFFINNFMSSSSVQELQPDTLHPRRTGGSASVEEIFALGGIFIHAFSLASSSLVEEEQYTWHFLLSSLSLAFIRQTLQSNPSSCDSKGQDFEMLQPDLLLFQGEKDVNGLLKETEGDGLNSDFRTPTESLTHTEFYWTFTLEIFPLLLILTTGRLLRAWHRSGVNWTYLPDIAKWLDEGNPAISSTLTYVSLCFVSIVGSGLVLFPLPKQLLRQAIVVCLGVATILISLFKKLAISGGSVNVDNLPTLIARVVFGVLSFTSVSAFVCFPWVVPLPPRSATTQSGCPMREQRWDAVVLEAGVQSALDSIGKVLISCWCLLQLLLQQSVNAGPVALLFLQLLIVVHYLRQTRLRHSYWLSVLMLQWMGASGHFALGNSNTLATVDVAGAYIGLSSHSTVLSGLLAFIITYASPFLFSLGMLLWTYPLRTKKIKTVVGDYWRRPNFQQKWQLEALTVPCILPMALNGVSLVVFTAILVAMQNHLFVWSVFSPKYLYFCAATVCTSLGVLIFAMTGSYVRWVISQRAHWLSMCTK